MKVRLSTVSFVGEGYIDCRKCERRVTFPEGACLIVYDFGDWQTIRYATNRAVAHQCGHEYFWQCDECGAEPTFEISPRVLRRRRRQHVLRCTCGGEFQQRRSLLPAPDFAATPF